MAARALITGAGAPGGIGMACARALGQAGFALAITATSGRIHARAAELMAEGFSVTAHQGDLTDPVAVARLHEAVGPVDVLVNNAGMGSVGAPAATGMFLDLTPEEWRRALDASLTTAVLTTRAFLPGMVARGAGRVVMMASVTGPMVSSPGESAYSTAKAAMVGLTHALALEVAARGVTVNAVAPGYFATEMNAALIEKKEFNDWVCARTPTGRWGRPDELGPACVFLASDEASFVNGHVLVVDGAFTAAM